MLEEISGELSLLIFILGSGGGGAVGIFRLFREDAAARLMALIYFQNDVAHYFFSNDWVEENNK